MDVGMEEGAGERERRVKIPAGVCDVAQRIMAGYDVWRLNLKKEEKKRTKFHKAI